MTFQRSSVVLMAPLVVALAACGSSDGGGGGGGGGTTSGTTTSEGPCGGEVCGADEYCDYQYNSCGPASLFGLTGGCVARDAACEPTVPACGCDNEVYQSACDAYAAGVDIGGTCPVGKAPEGTFPCRAWFCDAATTFCHVKEGDQGDIWATCEPLPSECNGVASCDCLPEPFFRANCSSVEGNGVTGIRMDEVLI